MPSCSVMKHPLWTVRRYSARTTQRIVPTSTAPGERLRAPHGSDHASPRTTSRTELVGLCDKSFAVVQPQRCDGDLPLRQGEGRGDAPRADCTAIFPEEASDLLAERRWHSQNSRPEDTATFSGPSTGSSRTEARRAREPYRPRVGAHAVARDAAGGVGGSEADRDVTLIADLDAFLQGTPALRRLRLRRRQRPRPDGVYVRRGDQSERGR